MTFRRNGLRFSVVAVASLLAIGLADPTWAVDGVIEINQASVKAAGGFPFSITQRGSYRLTGNLDVTDASARPAGQAPENTTAIFVTGSDITIDLNGFSIVGPSVCVGSPTTSCTPSGNGIGVFHQSGSTLTVMNGEVRGMGSTGVNLDGTGDRAERLVLIDNGSFGIAGSQGEGLLARGCTVIGGTKTGIVTSPNSLVDGNIVSNMGVAGINLSIGNSGYENNILNGNTAPVVGGVNLGHNLCNSIICP